MWQFNLGAHAYILIIFFFEVMVALSKDLNVGLSNIFSCGMSLTEIQIRAHCNFLACCNIWGGRFVQDGVMQM